MESEVRKSYEALDEQKDKNYQFLEEFFPAMYRK
jgi:hypothetical protein